VAPVMVLFSPFFLGVCLLSGAGPPDDVRCGGSPHHPLIRFPPVVCVCQALGHLMTCGADALERLMHETVLPLLKKLVFDRTAAIRRQLIVVVSAWLRRPASAGGADFRVSVWSWLCGVHGSVCV
jgi:hypothetical protein